MHWYSLASDKIPLFFKILTESLNDIQKTLQKALLDAQKDYEKAIELDPEDAVAFNNLGLVEEKMGRMEKAKDYFEKADSLSGYPPKKEAEVTPSETPNQTEKPKPTRPNTPVFKPKLTMGHFMEVVQGIFTKSEVRKEFTTYIKGVFGKK